MNQDQMNLLHRIFAVNEQVVKQNYQIMTVLTQPTITRLTEWKDLTSKDLETIRANAQNTEWAMRMAQSTLKDKNNG